MESEFVSLRDAPRAFKVALLEELDFVVDGDVIRDADGNMQRDRYSNRAVRPDSFMILPGSLLLLEDTPVSLAAYYEEFGEET